MIIRKADLFFVGGGSDKEYHVQLDDIAGLYTVACQWGRRGSTLQTGVKAEGVKLEVADRMFKKVVAEKVGKGYVEVSDSGVGYVAPEGSTAAKPTTTPPSFIPQLLNPIEESELEGYLRDEGYGLQEKKDGKHQVVCFNDGEMRVYNKKGKEIGYPAVWRDAISVSVVLDGEAIGEVFHVFDLLEVGGEDYRGRGYGDRFARLSGMSFGASVRVVPLVVGYKAKRQEYERLLGEGREGVVFKRLDAVYTPGKGHADMVKHKFYSEASVRVCVGREGKHSIGMEVLDDKGTWVFVGHCTIGQATYLPSIGSVVEVRYLNYQAGGSLYQPSFKGIRDDVDFEECVLSQLKHKAKEDDE
jgi:bifunctional non-homologous end joining protein LigD